MPILDQIVDPNGTVRRMGSLQKPDGFLSTFRTFETEYPKWEDKDIKRTLLDPERRVCRKIFDSYWKLDQHSVGSCNGWAAAGGLAKTRWFRGLQDKLKFSGAYLYSLMNGGQDNGSMLEDGLRLLQTKGCSLHDTVAWNKIYRNSYDRVKADEEAALYKGLACYAIQTLQGLRTAGAIGYMVIVAVHAGNNFFRLNSSGISGVDNGKGNHSILLQDMAIQNGTEVYDHDGSWGLSFGQNGNSYLVADHFAQTMDHHQFYAIVSTQEGSRITPSTGSRILVP